MKKLVKKTNVKRQSVPVVAQKVAAEKDYRQWICELKKRYRAVQIKAAVAVNSALIEFYWNLGRDISEKFSERAKYGSGFFESVSRDMREDFSGDSGFSPRNIRYCRDFHVLYSSTLILQQGVAKSQKAHAENLQQLVAKLICVPWGHHRAHPALARQGCRFSRA